MHSCSFFRLLVRSLAQVMFLTPKPAFVTTVPVHHPYIGAIFGTNAFCILLHLVTRRPEAGELTRGYLHGSVILDFIGQKGPTSKLQLVALDLLILLLQVFMLAVHVEKERLKMLLTSEGQTEGGVGTSAVTGQDLDAEERGMLRGIVADSSGAIEMQEFHSPDGARNGNDTQAIDQNEELQHLLRETSGRAEENTPDSPLDLFYSGNAIVADFHVLDTLRNQWADHDAASTTALRTVGHTAGYNWARMQHRLARLDTIR